MVFAARGASILPSIKCSNCGVEIEISMMGDHVCSQASSVPEPPRSQQPVNGPFAPSAFKYTKIEQRGLRITPPSNNTSVANRPPRPTAFAPRRPSNLSQTTSPTFNGRQSPMSLQPGTTTLPTTPPSPEAISQDSAFPIFPTTKPRNATPTTPSDSSRPPTSDARLNQVQQDQFGVFAPLSPRRLGGDDVMSRLKTLSPGPFDTEKKRDFRGHKKTSTASSIEDFIRSPNSHSVRSSDNTGHSRNESQSSAAGAVMRKASPERRHPATKSTGLTSSGRSGSVDSYGLKPLPSSTNKSQAPPPLGQIGRSQTSPVESGKSGEFGSISERTQSKPSYHRPTPSLAAAIRPLDEIGSMSSFKPSRSLRGRQPPAPTQTSEPRPPSQPESRADQRYQDAPPVPKPTRALDFGIGNPYHFSTESNSSNDSAGSDLRTASSRSSPPLTESPQRTKKTDTSRLDTLMNGFQLDLDNSSTSSPEEPGPPRRSNPPRSFSRPLYPRPTEPAPRDQDLDRDPAIQAPAAPKQPHHPPPKPSSPAPPSKGLCRGCSCPILGKSVSSTDPRLAGRWHKTCFVCSTCSAPFPTGQFYILRNAPYCAQHYHALNGSLCTACKGGIEGPYLETEGGGGGGGGLGGGSGGGGGGGGEKFHPTCFRCSDCKCVLSEEYFELGGRAYCERHAFRVGGGGLGGGGNIVEGGKGRRFPERRTTRLMMM